jgi:hypothetical protein
MNIGSSLVALTQIYATVNNKWGIEYIQNSFYFFDFHEADTNAYSQEEFENPLKLFKDCHFFVWN